MVTNKSISQISDKHLLQCPKCSNGKLFKDDNELTCYSCGYTRYLPLLPRVPKSDVY
jgi:ribosomal protein S27AE